ncbi:MAG: Hpt domain-containing protein [Microbacteriaceae bacterium]|nr:MAG: Hpt domain-containing protein [Microbacteriaceae bacterium]
MSGNNVANDELIDPQAWDAIVAQLCGSTAIASRFVADFVSAWPARLDRLSAALETADADAAYVTLLSMRTGGEMIGAVRLARRIAKLERFVRANRLDECRRGLDKLRCTGEQTIRALAHV